MSMINGGHLAVKYMKEVEQVDIIFTLSGGHIESVLDGCTEYNVRTIDVRHEQTAAIMGHAWSVYKNKPGVCLVTAGPGFTNALTGIANAHLENIPLVVISGRHPQGEDLKGALQELNQVDMVKPITKWCATCYETKRIPEYLSIAFRQAVTGRPGPVFLEIPADTAFAEVDEKDIVFPQKRHRKTCMKPDENDVKNAAAIINNAQKPLFLGGTGVGMSDCGEVLTAFIEKTGMPAALINHGRGVLPDTHPCSVTGGGFTGLNAALPAVDVIVATGVRFNWVLQSGDLFPDATVIRIDIDEQEIDRNRHADIGLVGDAGEVLEMLLPVVKDRDQSEWIDAYTTAYKAFMTTELETREKPSDPIHPIRLTQQIMNVFGDDAIYVADGGDTSYYGLSGLSSQHKAGVQTPAAGLFGCIGTGIPFALAAKLAHPDKQVVLLQGDGSFGFNGMEFDTAIRHNLPFICVVNNDCAWGMIKHSQGASIGEDRTTCAELGMRNYEKIVEALGGYGELVTTDEDVAPALQRAIESGKPSLINVVTDPTVTSPATVLFYQTFSAM